MGFSVGVERADRHSGITKDNPQPRSAAVADKSRTHRQHDQFLHVPAVEHHRHRPRPGIGQHGIALRRPQTSASGRASSPGTPPRSRRNPGPDAATIRSRPPHFPPPHSSPTENRRRSIPRHDESGDSTASNPSVIGARRASQARTRRSSAGSTRSLRLEAFAARAAHGTEHVFRGKQVELFVVGRVHDPCRQRLSRTSPRRIWLLTVPSGRARRCAVSV